MDHDRLFKELLTTFFVEFVELFLPDLSKYMDRRHLQFIDKEIFTDIASGERHQVDLLVKARFRGQGDVFFLIHLENQARAEPDFAQRMFLYCAKLYLKYRLPVFPIAIFSYDRPVRAEPDRFRMEFPGFRVLEFVFRVIQLNRLNWREFLKKPNPVASALMTKMKFAPKDRPRVKLECLRMMATLKLDRARSTLIATFMDNYLKLTAAEIKVYNKAVQAIEPKEREVVVQYTNEWIREGEAKGRRQVLQRLLRRKLGQLPPTVEASLVALSDRAADELVEAVFDLQSVADLNGWLSQHSGRKRRMARSR